MAKTGHPNINLRYKAPWRGIIKTWSLQFNYSGATLSMDQQVAFAQAVHNFVVAPFFSQHATSQYLSGFSSYDGQVSKALQEAEYADAAASLAAGWNGASSYGTAYNGAEDLAVSGLEACAVLLAPLGTNSKGKPFYMRKYIHGVPGMVGDTDNLPIGSGQDAAAKLGDGSLPGNRVLCTDSGAQGTWSAQVYIGNHKLFRAYKKTAPASVLKTIEDELGNLAPYLVKK